jgi:ADP-heptose:LPS heptosyltransferase
MGKNGLTRPQTILIIRGGAYGDVLLALSLLPVINKKYPGCSIDFATSLPALLEGNPFIRHCVSLPVDDSLYDLVINLDLAYEKQPHLSIMRSYADVAGVSVDDMQLSLSLPESSIKKADALLSAWPAIPGQKTIALQSSSGFWTKNLPLVAINSIVHLLRESLAVRIFLLGTDSAPPVQGTIDLRGKTDVMTSLAIIAQCDAFIGFDSFLLHGAKSINVPVAVFFGPSNPDLRFPVAATDLVLVSPIACRFCHHRQRPPAFVTVCKKAPFFTRCLDRLLQVSFTMYSRKSTAFSRRFVGVMIKNLATRSASYPTAACMNLFSPDDCASKIIAWINLLPSPAAVPEKRSGRPA